MREEGRNHPSRLRVEVPGPGYHRRLIACQDACPVHTDARGYVRAIAEGRFEEAYLIARGPNPFASICGRICGAPCEAACRRGRIPRTDDDGSFVGPDRPIAIRALKRFACEQAGVEVRDPRDAIDAARSWVPRVCADAEEMAALLRALVSERLPSARGERIAIIGSGPAGLSCAHDLALMGFRPVVYDSEPVAAGMLAVGVPEYRLPRELIRREVAVIEALGVEIRCGVTVGRDVSFRRLRDEHAAVVLAVGAKRPRALGLPGERGPGVLGGVDFLRAVALGEAPHVGRSAVVIGGGNVAYDVARTVLRQIAYDAARAAARLRDTRRVVLVSLETLEEMPADTVEIVEGDEEGIERLNGWGPVEVLRDARGRVTGLALRRCLRVYDDERRFAPRFDDGQQRTVDCDTVLMATGQSTDLGFLADGGADVEQSRPGWPRVDPDTLATTGRGVFVAGDLAHGTRLLIDAVASGKRAARSVYHHVCGSEIAMEVLETYMALPLYSRERRYDTLSREQVPTLPPETRLADPSATVEIGYDATTACREASRCLDCGVTPVFDGGRCVLCGGCVDVCPTLCLKLVSLADLAGDTEIDRLIDEGLGPSVDLDDNSAILKDEDHCIRCGLCALRCPVEAITMERIRFQTHWRTA
ncbi:MAG TPA: FAD-dependent oxidoreductase [Candidatus Polarisedimenticolaceae bacterium]|nr:FAD-dependent oxidoreductase [Candidatus Polarisedimenticolaceae bacterium]